MIDGKYKTVPLTAHAIHILYVNKSKHFLTTQRNKKLTIKRMKEQKRHLTFGEV